MSNDKRSAGSIIKSILGYSWAALAIPILLATFVGLNFFANALAKGTGVRVSPWYNGGEVVATIQHQGYETRIHQPVFDAIVGQTRMGFVQINWVPLQETQLPGIIEEDIALPGNNSPSFHIRIDVQNNTASVTPMDTNITSNCYVINLGKEKAARVELRNPSGLWPFRPAWS